MTWWRQTKYSLNFSQGLVHFINGCIFFWYRDVFFVVSRCPKSPFWYRDLFFGIEILHSVVQHLVPGINLCVPCLGLDIL